MKFLAIISVILALTGCQSLTLGTSRNEIYGLKACQAFTGMYETVTALILDDKLSKAQIEKFEKIKSVAEPYCLKADFSEKGTAEYVASSVVELVLITKGK